MRRSSIAFGVVRMLGVMGVWVCAATVRADTPGFAVGPAHAALPSVYSRCWTMWDPDGGGPNPPLFVVAPNNYGLFAWDGSSFLSFGGDVGFVKCMAIYNGQLYAGGAFQKMGSDSVTNLARWDGTHWQTLGTGLIPQGDGYNPKGVVNSLVVHGGVLYIGGSLMLSGHDTWNSTATWDGTSLQPDRTLFSPISSMIEIGGQLYATTTHNNPGVYRYDAASWYRFGHFADTSILTLVQYNGDLICGGDFTHFFTGVNMPGIARWNGTDWVPLGAGLGPQGLCEVTSLAVYNGVLVAAGGFDHAGGIPVHNVAQWDGTQWSDMDGGFHLLGNGYENGVKALAPLDGQLVAMGYFTSASGRPEPGIARWNGDTWLGFHPGIDAPVRAFDPAGSGIYAGGDFQFDWSGASLRHVIGVDGTNVNALAGLGTNNGVDGTVRALTLHQIDPVTGSELVAGGAFAQAGDAPAQNVAAYLYPGGWSALGSGLNSTVNAVASYGGALYAAGAFTASGGTTLSHIARFAGGSWVDPGFHSFLTLYAMSAIGGKLVIGGRFGGKPLTPPADGVSAWDGTSLNLVGTSDGPVYALAGYQGDIVAAGAFGSMDGVSTPSGIARRNATTGAWSAMGPAFALGVPYALAVYDGNLWVGGSLMQSVAADFGRVFMWNGSVWVGSAGGLDGTVYALAPLGSRLQIGGDFQRADAGLESPYWITLNDGVVAVDPGAHPAMFAPGTCAPNPTHGRSRVEFSLDRAARTRIAILDVAGRQVRGLTDAMFQPGDHTAAWDGIDDTGRPCPAGLYFYRITTDRMAVTRRVVLVR